MFETFRFKTRKDFMKLIFRAISKGILLLIVFGIETQGMTLIGVFL